MDAQELSQEKLRRLRRAYIIETDEAVKFKLERQIAAAERELAGLPPDADVPGRPSEPTPAPGIMIHTMQGDITMGKTQTGNVTYVSGDNFDSGDGPQNIAQDQANAVQTNDMFAALASVEELLRLLATIQQEIARLPVSDEVKDEVLNEVQGAEIQAKKPEPDKTKIADKLKSAAAALKEEAAAAKGAVTAGNLLGQAIRWCGEQWTQWM